jgi:hypothetical protein
MRVICCQDGAEFLVPDNVLTQSPLLSDLHSLDPEGCPELPCGRGAWEAWAAGDPLGIHEVQLLHDVIEVSFVYINRASQTVPLVADLHSVPSAACHAHKKCASVDC